MKKYMYEEMTFSAENVISSYMYFFMFIMRLTLRSEVARWPILHRCLAESTTFLFVAICSGDNCFSCS